jgi:hypothetical protein
MSWDGAVRVARKGKLAPSTIAVPVAAVHPYGASSNGNMETSEDRVRRDPTQQEIDDESRRIRRLRILVQLTVQTIADGGLSAEEASGMIAATRRVALEMFPGKERAFDLIYRPQFQRVMHAVYRLQ